MTLTRREFLRKSSCSALSVAALASGIERFGLVHAFAQGTTYKALVCIFLGGGNDGNNTVVPKATTSIVPGVDYSAYAAVRSASGLAIAQGNLLSITPLSIPIEF